MHRLFPVLALLVSLFLPAVSHAQSESPCAPYDVVAAALLKKYHEAPVARMLSDRGFVIEILASPDGATATVLGVQASLTACVLATGSGYALVPASEAAPPGNPS